MCKCEDENYLRKIIREELTKMRQEHVQQKDNPVNKLVALYFDNFPTDLVKPSGGLVGANVKLILKQLPYEQLELLIPILASAGKPISAAWCNWAKEQLKPRERQTPPTPMADRYNPEEFTNPKAVPMPNEIRDMLQKGLGRSVSDV